MADKDDDMKSNTSCNSSIILSGSSVHKRGHLDISKRMYADQFVHFEAVRTVLFLTVVWNLQLFFLHTVDNFHKQMKCKLLGLVMNCFTLHKLRKQR